MKFFAISMPAPPHRAGPDSVRWFDSSDPAAVEEALEEVRQLQSEPNSNRTIIIRKLDPWYHVVSMRQKGQHESQWFEEIREALEWAGDEFESGAESGEELQDLARELRETAEE